MSMKLSLPLTVEQFLAWERGQGLRYEFDGLRVIAMTGGSLNHSAIATNIVSALVRRLKPPCRAYRGDVKILVADGVRYPDAVVTCSPVDGSSDIVPNQVVVFELLSPSTASVDRLVKNEEYRTTRSIQRYVMLEQTRIGATVFARAEDRWIGTVMLGEAMLEMPECDVTIPLTEFYQDVDLPPPDTDD
jgi:Uma2 family endonuclease